MNDEVKCREKGCRLTVRKSKKFSRLQNSPYFCVFMYARAVKQKVWNEAEYRERDLGRDAKRGSRASRA